ncbi:MAG: prolyl oligopeptidase family serine peptidase [Chloroflexota bacterium]|nr:prolyl oligopeptidase family serine peptidase [Chloroflexota bacterium]
MSLKNAMQSSRTKTNHQMAALRFSLALGLSLLILTLNLPGVARAHEPEDGPGQSGQESGSTIVGLVSNALEYLAVGNDLSGQASGIVRLNWQGQVERARLVLSVAGAEAAHTIKVNGQPAALVPVLPGGQPRDTEEYFYLDISPDVVVPGDNLIEITNDALPGDSWTAANVRLEVFGDFTILQTDQYSTEQVGATSATSVTLVITFTNSYDDSSQEAVLQIPDDYDSGTPTPLLVAVHPRSNVMEWGINTFGAAANSKDWLLVSPQLHGSWPGDPQPEHPGYFAYASLESQYDAIGAANYVVENYNVKPDQIYLAGYSMGGQGGVVTVAKFPHLFAAVFDNKGPTDMVEWYDEQVDYYGDANHSRVLAMRRECHIDENPKTPTENPFCYQRRSGINFASNYIHVPISITHSISDVLVPIHHSRDLRDAINGYGPDQPVSLAEDTVVGPTCSPPGYHCYEPDAMAVLNFLEPFTLNNNPTHVNITTDESKSYYWMNLAQTGGDHWSQVEVSYYPVSATVTAITSDTEALAVGFNLGSTPMTGIIEQPGMGLPATTYLIKGGGNDDLHDYTSGYLTVTLASPGQFALTISAITVDVSAQPDMVSGGQTSTSTITAVAKDHLNNPVPDGTTIELSTTEGTFPNASSTYAAIAAGGMVTTFLTLPPGAGPAEIVASVGSVTDSTPVDVIYPAIAVLVTPHQTMAYSEQVITYTYRLTNTGDVTLTGVTLVDDNGTPMDSSDDITVCQDITLVTGAATSSSRSPTLAQTTTNTATATGRDPLDNPVTNNGSATVNVISPAIKMTITSPQMVIDDGQIVVTYTYRLTNTGDVTLTGVRLVDDNGTPGDSGDDALVCTDITLTPGATTSCGRSTTLTQTTTNTATATGQDPLDNPVTSSASTTVGVSKVYLPIITRNKGS